MNDHLTKQIAFIGELEKLKRVTRQNKTLDDRFENSAEHSWHAALMAPLLAEYAPEGCDISRVTLMLLVHDIVEIDCGDTFLYDETARREVEAEEDAAALRLFGMLPQEMSEHLLALWREFEADQSADAQFAKVLDALQPIINHPITRTDGQNIHDLKRSQVEAKKAFIQERVPALWPVVLNALETCVEKGLVIDA